MISWFETLVGHLSKAEVFVGGKIGIVAGYRVTDAQRLFIKVALPDGTEHHYLQEFIEPSPALQKLIKDGTYCEKTMTWHGIVNGKPVTEKIEY